MGYSPKYGYVSTEKNEVPDDEPVFMVRARDNLALGVIVNYLAESIKTGTSKRHLSLLLTNIEEFQLWREAHPEETKDPDSHLSGGMADV